MTLGPQRPRPVQAPPLHQGLQPAPVGIRPRLDHRDGLALAYRQSNPSRMSVSVPCLFLNLFQ